MILLVIANARMAYSLSRCTHPYGGRHLLFISTTTQCLKPYFSQSLEDVHKDFTRCESVVRKLSYAFEILQQAKSHNLGCKVVTMGLKRGKWVHKENGIMLIFS